MNLESLLAIQRLLYEYAELIDAGDYEGIARLFQYGRITTENPDGTPDEPGNVGFEEVLKMYKSSTRLYPDGTPKSKHIVTNLIIDIEPDDQSAGARSYFTVLQKTDALPLQPIITGKYKDTFARESDADKSWQFRERIMVMDQIGDLSQHLLFDLPE